MNQHDTQSVGGLSRESERFLVSAGVRYHSAALLASAGRNVWKITESPDRVLVLKVAPRHSGFRSKVRSVLVGSLGFQRELWFYNGVARVSCNGLFPSIVASDANHLLIEWVNGASRSHWEIPEGAWQVLASALVEFQWNVPVVHRSAVFRSKAHRVIYGPQGLACRVVLPFLLREFGVSVAGSYAKILARCYLRQQALPRRCLSHNDLSPNNVVVAEDLSRVCFIDFQDVTIEPRWAMFDAVRLCYGFGVRRDFELHIPFLSCYVAGLSPEIREYVNIAVQLRFCLMIRVVQQMMWLRSKGKDREFQHAAEMLFEVMDDRVFGDWSRGVAA